MTRETLRETPADRNPIPCYELRPWAEDLGVVAGLTLRGHDFGLAGESPVREALERWRSFRHQMRSGFTSVAVAHQCHGTRVAVHGTPAADWHLLDDTDGHLTAAAGILLGITVADCIPVYLAHPESGCVGLLHAGWRGVAGGIIEQGTRLLCRLSGSPPADMVMHCGVGICANCYEVGADVYQAVGGEAATGPRQLDLRTHIARRAEALGVRRMTISPWCAAHDAAVFYSHRRSGGADGRMVAYVGRPLA